MCVVGNILIQKELETSYNHAAHFAGNHLPLPFSKLLESSTAIDLKIKIINDRKGGLANNRLFCPTQWVHSQ
jgi:hypothetical protein